MSTGAKRAESRVLAALLLCVVFVLLAQRKTKKAAPIAEPPLTEDDTQPVRPVRRSMEDRERDAQEAIERMRTREQQYPPVVTGEE